ncbi:MAG: hypothetical protein ACE5IR_23680 [bacterium]
MIGKTILTLSSLREVGREWHGIVYKAEDNKRKRDVSITFLRRKMALKQ